ncbi:hypothetical protein E3Q18_01058 [Wallemia mellicola]|nr:hypothetical protein E3Q19_01368 [Wallemia mellicola]TIC00658.1 hypothetical protein E3Q18_01058 [Wallemia mellicola]TIC19091.1 hypothetical protein E3Q13_01470 [Wallemia mellicola]TIC56069.1 hypothetical protein E3Q05_01928 [Wallemia mellicola]TIC74110.1 hypothetical protein E3Q00_02261 [Wallemia mellicola]
MRIFTIARKQLQDIAYKDSKPLKLTRKLNDPHGQFEYTGKSLLTPREELRFRLAVSTNAFTPSSQNELEARREWVEKQREWRYRLRGIKYNKDDDLKSIKDGSISTLNQFNLVGLPVFLPNITFRLMRNHTPAGKEYNPYFATFRIPRSLTKQDIRSYLLAVYGVRSTWIHTDLYQPRLVRGMNMRWKRKGRGDATTGRGFYKRALVGLEEPFYFPDEPTREELENKYAYSEREWMTRRMLMAFQKGWRWRGVQETGQRGATQRLPNVLKAVSIRRAQREEAIADQVEKIRQMRL